MAFIYSRPRIHFPKILAIPAHSPKHHKRHKVVGIILLCAIGAGALLRGIMPIFNKLCIDKAKSIATFITNQETTKVLQNYEYSDFMLIHKDEKGNILMLEANMKNINYIISEIANQIQTSIDQLDSEEIYIYLGSFTGIHFLAGRGIKIPIRMATIGNVKTTVKSEWVSQGINQTLHRLYLEIESEVSILTPFYPLQETITNQLVIAENVIVGNIPNSYYNIEGIGENQALELVK